MCTLTYISVHRRVRSLLNTIELKDVDRTKVTSDLENRYEHKLAEQMDRYDLLVSTYVDFRNLILLSFSDNYQLLA